MIHAGLEAFILEEQDRNRSLQEQLADAEQLKFEDMGRARGAESNYVKLVDLCRCHACQGTQDKSC